ncbi:MAG TPA: 4-alpha-glucanotransferase, partial [Elusimicrobiales bacterium]|nr:4-alpha-glucanotransferase [Elusimicrobiales bacterium]
MKRFTPFTACLAIGLAMAGQLPAGAAQPKQDPLSLMLNWINRTDELPPTYKLKFHPANNGRHAGILLPLFSMRDSRDWGIGDFTTLQLWSDWAKGAGLKILQILPIHETLPYDPSPYKALSAFALNPLYISIEDMADANASKEARALLNSAETAKKLAELRASPSVDYAGIKELKYQVFELCFRDFQEKELKTGSNRAKEFNKFQETTWWLEDYALFRVINDANDW